VLLFFCALGVLVSLRAPTVRQAQSRLVLVFVGFFVGIVILSLLGKHTAPAEALRFVASERGQLMIVSAWLLIFGAVDLALVLLAWGRFRRDQLIEIR
jgi:fucose permease